MRGSPTSLHRRSTLAGLLICLGAAGACATVQGAAKPVARGITSAPTRALDAVTLAARLAEFGAATNSALAIATAAQILLDNPPSPLDATPNTKFHAAPTDRGSKTSAPVDLDVARLLAAARSIGGGDPQVTALISELESRTTPRSKGAVSGPKSAWSDVLARSTDEYSIAFRGGELASVRVTGDGDTDLDCYVYSSRGTLVASDADYSDYCILDWWPSSSGTYRIEIRNLGDVYNRYTIVTN